MASCEFPPAALGKRTRLFAEAEVNDIMFALHARLAADTARLGRLQLSLLLMMNDATYPSFILVPEREHAREIFELVEADRLALIEEIALVSRAFRRRFGPTSSTSPRSATWCRNCMFM